MTDYIYIYVYIKIYLLKGVTLCSNTFPVLENVFNQLGEGLAQQHILNR